MKEGELGSALSVVVAEVPKNAVLRLGFTSFWCSRQFSPAKIWSSSPYVGGNS